MFVISRTAIASATLSQVAVRAPPATRRSPRSLIEHQVRALRVFHVVLLGVDDGGGEPPLYRGSRLQRFEPALHMRELTGILALALPSRSPADGGHIGDRIFCAGQIGMLRKPLVHHPVESIALVGIAIDGIRNFLGCIDAEMMGLPSHRAAVSHLPKQPFVDRYASPLVGGIELPGLAPEVLQNGAGLEPRNRLSAATLRIDDRRHAVVRR